MINQGFNTVVSNLNVDRLYVSAKTNMTDGLPIAHSNRIKSVPGVRAVSHWTYFGGYYQDARKPIPASATDAEPLFQVYKEMKIKPECIDAMTKTRTGALVSEQLAKQYNWKIGDRVPIGTSIWTKKDGGSTWDFDIVGTFESSVYGGGFPSFYINYAYFDEASAFGGGVVHYYLVGIDDPQKATQVSGAIDGLFASSTNETRTQTESALAQMQLKQIGATHDSPLAGRESKETRAPNAASRIESCNSRLTAHGSRLTTDHLTFALHGVTLAAVAAGCVRSACRRAHESRRSRSGRRYFSRSACGR